MWLTLAIVDGSMTHEVLKTLRNPSLIYSSRFVREVPWIVPIFGAKAKLWTQNEGMSKTDLSRPPEDFLKLSLEEKEEAMKAPKGILQATEHADRGVYAIVPAIQEMHNNALDVKSGLEPSHSLHDDIFLKLISEFRQIEIGLKDNGVTKYGEFVAWVITQKVLSNFTAPFFPRYPNNPSEQSSLVVYEAGREQARAYRKLAKEIEASKEKPDGKDYSEVSGMGGQYKAVLWTNGNTPTKFIPARYKAIDTIARVGDVYRREFPDSGTILLDWYSRHAPGILPQLIERIGTDYLTEKRI